MNSRSELTSYSINPEMILHLHLQILLRVRNKDIAHSRSSPDNMTPKSCQRVNFNTGLHNAIMKGHFVIKVTQHLPSPKRDGLYFRPERNLRFSPSVICAVDGSTAHQNLKRLKPALSRFSVMLHLYDWWISVFMSTFRHSEARLFSIPFLHSHCLFSLLDHIN